jgi:hypothetical protein
MSSVVSSGRFGWGRRSGRSRSCRQSPSSWSATCGPYGFGTTSGYETIGSRPEGPSTICTRGRVEDLPEQDRIFWHDGESNYGLKYAGRRCIHQQ